MKHKDICKDVLRRFERFSGLDGLCCSEEEFLLNYPPNDCASNGEIDVYCISPHFKAVLEVKGNDTPRNRKKAYKQLDKDVLFIQECYGIDDVVKMYAYSDPSRHRGYNIERINI